MPISNQEKVQIYSDLENYQGWNKGFTNIKSENEIDPKTELLDAINIDITDNGKLRLRKGLNRLFQGNVSSMFSFNGLLYGVLDDKFVSFDNSFNYSVIKENINYNLTMKYIELNNELYFSNGVDSGKININGNFEPWLIESPIDAPVLTVSTGGLLPKGRYIVAYSYKFGSYETSISPIQIIEITEDNSKIDISCRGYQYATDCVVYAQNGEMLYRIGYGFNYTFDNVNQIDGKIPKSEELRGFPVCNNICYHNGRIYGSINEFMFYTEPFDYRQYNPVSNTLNIDNTEILSIMEYLGGLIVCTKKGVYKIDGEINKSALVKLSSAIAVKNTEFEHETKKLFGILTNHGVMLFSDDGQVQNLSENLVDFSNYENGSSLFRMQDGIVSVVFSLDKTGEDTEYQSKGYKDNRIMY